MNLHSLTVVLILSVTMGASAQNTTSSRIRSIKLTGDQFSARLFLRTDESVLNLIYHPALMPEDLKKTLSRGFIKTDSGYYKREGVSVKGGIRIFLKDSYSWSLGDAMPVVRMPQVIKLRLKRRKKLTTNDWKLIRYMQFCAEYDRERRKRFIDKYKYHQEIYLEDKKVYDIIYEIGYNAQGRFEKRSVEIVPAN